MNGQPNTDTAQLEAVPPSAPRRRWRAVLVAFGALLLAGIVGALLLQPVQGGKAGFSDAVNGDVVVSGDTLTLTTGDGGKAFNADLGNIRPAITTTVVPNVAKFTVKAAGSLRGKLQLSGPLDATGQPTTSGFTCTAGINGTPSQGILNDDIRVAVYLEGTVPPDPADYITLGDFAGVQALPGMQADGTYASDGFVAPGATGTYNIAVYLKSTAHDNLYQGVPCSWKTYVMIVQGS